MKLFLLCLFLLTGCGKNVTNSALYSNLGGEASQREIKELLVQKDVSSSSIDTYFHYVTDINQRAISPLVNEFVPMTKDSVSYSDFVFKSSENLEMNGKVASFILIKDEIEIETPCNLQDKYIEDDISFLSNTLSLSTEDIQAYACAYATIQVSKDLANHLSSIDKFHQEHELEFSQDQSIFLIRIYVHNPTTQVRYVAHAGVLIEKFKDLIFIEKYGANHPFQVTKFDNRMQLIHYLLDRANLQPNKALVPLIYENSKLISPTS